MSNTSKRATSVDLHRVVITGTGAVSPAGMGVDTLWSKLVAGECCLTKLPEETIENLGVTVAGPVPGYDPIEAGFSKKEARRLARFVQFAVLAADEAMAQSGVDLEAEDLSRFACVFGSGIGGMEIFEHESIVLHERGYKRVNPLFIPIMISNMAAGNLSIRYGLRADCLNLVTACATGTHCVGEAYRLIRYGLADAVLAGGAEESVSAMSLAGFGQLGALSKAEDPMAASRPFDANRSGFVPGEGAGALVLESLEHAQARGANIIAEIVGFGSTGDAYHITAPEPSGDGAYRAMKMALDEAGLEPSDVTHFNAHGTATHMNDAVESKAIIKLVGEEAARRIPTTSVKGATGHMLGAAGAIEAIVCALSVRDGIVPPTCGFAEADPECPVNILTEALVDAPQKVALSTSLGFGGHNAVLALAPFTEA